MGNQAGSEYCCAGPRSPGEGQEPKLLELQAYQGIVALRPDRGAAGPPPPGAAPAPEERPRRRPPPTRRPPRPPTLLQRVGRGTCCSVSAPPQEGEREIRIYKGFELQAPQAPLGGPAAEGDPAEPLAVRMAAARREEAGQQARGAAAARPDLRGSWLLAKLEGDMALNLVDMNVGFVMRSAAKVINYGVGRVRKRIEQDGALYVSDKLLADGRLTHNEMTIGAGEQAGEGDLGPITVLPEWDGGVLRADVRLIDYKANCTWRLYLRGADELVDEVSTSSGATTRQIYSRTAPWVPGGDG